MNKQLYAVSVSSDFKVSSETTTGKVDKTKETFNATTESNDKVKIYPTPGTDVKLASDGSVTFKADSIISFTKRKTDQAREILKDIKESFHQNISASAKKDSTNETKTETKDVDRRPSSIGIFSNWVSLALCILIVVIGILYFLRRS